MNKAIYMGISKTRTGHDQKVFMMNPPLEGCQYVCVSARSMSEFSRQLSIATKLPADFLNLGIEDETYIFGCDPSGEILSWAELPGSFRGEMNIAKALEYAGYEIVESAEDLDEEKEAV